MFSFIILVCQGIFIIMVGSFFTTSKSTVLSSSPYITYGLVLMLAFVFMYAPYRKLSLFSLVMLLMVIVVAFQVNFLLGMFWDSCMQSSFTGNIQISAAFIVRCLYGVFAVLLTTLDILGLFEYWQVYIWIGVLMTIGYGLASSVIVYGLDIYDGGGGMTVFLYSGVCSLIIWAMCIRGKISVLEHKKSESYLNFTLAFIGVAMGLFSWPVFNMGGALTTFINTDLAESTSLVNSAYFNTFAALCTALLCSTMLTSRDSPSERLKPKVYIECFVNGGIIIATFNDLILNPVCGMIMAMTSTIITLIFDKYIFQKTEVRNQNDVKMLIFKYSKIIWRLLFSFVGCVIGAIVIASREGSTLQLLTTNADKYGLKAGLTVAAWLITFVIGIVFGIFCALGINKMMEIFPSKDIEFPEQSKITRIIDEHFFENLDEEIFPIYKDVFEHQGGDQQYQEDLTRRILHQSLIKQSQIANNIYQTARKNTDTNESDPKSNPIVGAQKQTILLTNDFSRSNLSPAKEINLSQMKMLRHDSSANEVKQFSDQEWPVASESINKNKSNVNRRSDYRNDLDGENGYNGQSKRGNRNNNNVGVSKDNIDDENLVRRAGEVGYNISTSAHPNNKSKRKKSLTELAANQNNVSNFESMRPQETSIISQPPSQMKINHSVERLSYLKMTENDELNQGNEPDTVINILKRQQEIQRQAKAGDKSSFVRKKLLYDDETKSEKGRMKNEKEQNNEMKKMEKDKKNGKSDFEYRSINQEGTIQKEKKSINL